MKVCGVLWGFFCSQSFGWTLTITFVLEKDKTEEEKKRELVGGGGMREGKGIRSAIERWKW